MRLVALIFTAASAMAQLAAFSTKPLPEAQQAQLAFNRGRAFYADGFGTYYGGPIQITAKSAEQQGNAVHYSGNVVIRTDTATIEADEIVLDRDTKTMVSRGSVRITPLTEPPK